MPHNPEARPRSLEADLRMFRAGRLQREKRSCREEFPAASKLSRSMEHEPHTAREAGSWPGLPWRGHGWAGPHLWASWQEVEGPGPGWGLAAPVRVCYRPPGSRGRGKSTGDGRRCVGSVMS